MGNLYLKTGQYDSAIQAFRETAETDDELLASVAYNNIGVTYLYKVRQLEGMRNQLPPSQFVEQRTQLLEEAEEAFHTALGRDQSILWSFDSYINVASERGRRAELEEEYRSILKTKEDYKAYYGLGKMAFNAAVADPSREREEFQLAVDYFAKAKKINATHKIMFFNNGYALDRLGRIDEAIESYLQAIRIEPLVGEAHPTVALLYIKKSELDRGLKHLQDSLRLDPKNASSHANMAAIYVRQSKTSRACQHLTEALTSSPSHVQATAIWNQAGCGNRPPGTVDLSRRTER
jgi:tetratricopeptide (TPR) repeat protein